jgi:hypothetical protein
MKTGRHANQRRQCVTAFRGRLDDMYKKPRIEAAVPSEPAPWATFLNSKTKASEPDLNAFARTL